MPAINITSALGTHVTGLTIGQVYTVVTSGGPWNPFAAGAFPLHDTYQFKLSLDDATWTVMAVSTDPGSPGYSDTAKPPWATSRRNLDTVHVEITWTATQTDFYIGVDDSVYGDNSGGLNYVLSQAGGFCPYGTELIPGRATTALIDGGLIDAALLLAPGGAWLALGFDTLAGISFSTTELCTLLPPPMPVFTAEDWISVVDGASPSMQSKLLQAFKAISWPIWCRCKTGTPTPVAPPAPSIQVQPVGTPLPPATISCNNADICTTLNELSRQLLAISQQLGFARTDIQLIQRQAVPFGHVTGTSHTGLAGAGSFSVSGLLGLVVVLTTVPGTWGLSDDVPQRYIPAPGSVAIGTAEGVSEVIFCNEPQSAVFPYAMSAATVVNWSFKPGVVATITELVREPSG